MVTDDPELDEPTDLDGPPNDDDQEPVEVDEDGEDA